MCENGEWETAVIELFTRTLREGDMVFDVGAFVGPYTLLASRLVGKSGRVIAFEPDPAMRRALADNLQWNEADNVTIEDFAIGSGPYLQRFHATEDSMSRLDSTGDTAVRVVSLDTYCRLRGLWPDVLKIDIEGGELCFHGSHSEAIHHARLVVLEVHKEQIERGGVSLGEFLDGFGSYEEVWRKSEGNFHVIVRN